MGYLLIMILELLHVASCPWLKNTTFSKSQTFISFCFYVYRVGNLPLGRQRSLCSWRWNSFETTKNPGTVNPFNIFQHLSTSVTQRVTQGLVEFATPAAVSQLNDHRSRHGNAVDLRASRCEAQRAISDLTGTVAWLKLITGSVWHWCRKKAGMMLLQ